MFDRHTSRRDLIRTGAAAVAAAALPRWALAKDEDPFAGFTVAVQSYTFRNFELEKAVAKIAECQKDMLASPAMSMRKGCAAS